jgi:hypothetical protein
LPPEKQANFLGGVVLDEEIYVDSVGKAAMHGLIATSPECEESRIALRHLGFTDRKMEEMNREVTALGPNLSLTGDEKRLMIKQGVMVAMAAVTTYAGVLPGLSSMSISYQALFWTALTLSVAKPLVRNIMSWVMNPRIRRQKAIQKATDEVKRYQTLVTGEPEAPTKKRPTRLDSLIVVDNLTLAGRIARKIASLIPFTAYRKRYKLEEKVRAQMMEEDIRRKLEDERRGVLASDPGNSLPERIIDPVA